MVLPMKYSKKTNSAGQKNGSTKRPRSRLSRRSFLGATAATGAGLSFPHIWVPRPVQAQTAGSGTIKHLIYIRLSGGFRFPCAFNGDVADRFNPFSTASGVPSGVQWGVSRLLESASYLGGPGTEGMRSPAELADKITVMPTVDHEPLSGGADGNHTTGLERYLTGFVNGEAGIFTRIMAGLSERYSTALAEGNLLLPAFVMGGSGMARGLGDWAQFRPPVLSGASFERFSSSEGAAPEWSERMITETDARMRDRQHPALRSQVDAYIQTREATEAYSEIFASEPLKVGNGSDEVFDGLSNAQLASIFGDSGESSDLRLGLRLFHYGCPAIYLDQGGYDYHSDEEPNLPGAIDRMGRLISGLIHALPLMNHPDGGTYWDHTVVAFGSEFSRTAGGSRFNSAQGSDHNGDYSTRWMSMPFFGGPITGGRIVGASTNRADLSPGGTVYSYRSVVNTLMDGLGCDPSVFFPADDFVPDLLREPA
jgi:hypothetical protein